MNFESEKYTAKYVQQRPLVASLSLNYAENLMTRRIDLNSQLWHFWSEKVQLHGRGTEIKKTTELSASVHVTWEKKKHAYIETGDDLYQALNMFVGLREGSFSVKVEENKAVLHFCKTQSEEFEQRRCSCWL